MLSSRKRKAIPEKGHENFKMRKLKVSNKIFRSPGSPKPNNVAKIKISKLLPEGYDSMIVTANTKVEENIEGNEAVYGCVRLPIITKEDALIWLKKFERNTSTSYHSQKTWKSDDKTGLLKRRFLCNHRVGGVYSCKACIIFTIKDATEIQTNPDYYLRDYPSQVIIQFCHNHKIDLDLYVKNLHPSTELRAIFVSSLWNVAHSLKITSLYVPRGATHEAPMNCRYDLEGEPLYDVKWYKDDMQFFGCMADGSVHAFPVEGVSIYYSNYAAVGSCPINLTKLTSNSGGIYKCEVSLDGPTFRTVSATKVFKVIQYSRRTQEMNDIDTQNIQSSFQNQTNTSTSGVAKPRSSIQVYLVIFMLTFCSF